MYVKIQDLPQAANIYPTDLFVINDNSGPSSITRSISAGQIQSFIDAYGSSVYTTVQRTSANWNTAYALVSGGIVSTISLPQSAIWQTTSNIVSSLSSNWNSVYTFVNANSAIIANTISLSTTAPNGIVYAKTGNFGTDPTGALWYKTQNGTSGWETVFTSTSGQYLADISLQDATGIVLNSGQLGTVAGNLVMGDGVTVGGNTISSGSSNTSLDSSYFQARVNSQIGYDKINILKNYTVSPAFSAANGFVLANDTTILNSNPGVIWACSNTWINTKFGTGGLYYALKAGSPGTGGAYVSTTTGYFRVVRWDGALTTLQGAASSAAYYTNPNVVGSKITMGSDPVAPYICNQIPFGIFSCDSTGTAVSGIISQISLPHAGLTAFDGSSLSSVAFSLDAEYINIGFGNFYGGQFIDLQQNNLTDLRVGNNLDDASTIFVGNNTQLTTISLSGLYKSTNKTGSYYPTGESGIQLSCDSCSSLSTLILPPSGVGYVYANNTQLKSWKGSDCEIIANYATSTPIASIDFSGIRISLQTVTATYSFGNAIMTAAQVDAAFNSIPSVMYINGCAGSYFRISGPLCAKPTAASATIRAALVLAGATVVTS